MLTFTGEWNYNSYLLIPTMEQFDGAPPMPTNAVKWAKGKLIVADETPAQGRLVFQTGVELAVELSLEKHDDQTVFHAKGVGMAGVTLGAIYHLSGWAHLNADGGVRELSGGVLAVRGPDARPVIELGGQAVGTVGYFRLSK